MKMLDERAPERKPAENIYITSKLAQDIDDYDPSGKICQQSERYAVNKNPPKQ